MGHKFSLDFMWRVKLDTNFLWIFCNGSNGTKILLEFFKSSKMGHKFSLDFLWRVKLDTNFLWILCDGSNGTKIFLEFFKSSKMGHKFSLDFLWRVKWDKNFLQRKTGIFGYFSKDSKFSPISNIESKHSKSETPSHISKHMYHTYKIETREIFMYFYIHKPVTR
jgi:hypothetical protein